MKKILLFCILFLNLFGSNPRIYSSLGDDIYNNLVNIESLKKLKKYNSYEKKINQYSLDVHEAKELGFEVESGRKSNLKLYYLDKLRKLSKVNKYFFRSVDSNFKKALQTQNNELFIGLVNSNMLNTKKYKKDILIYYNLHKKDISSVGIIQKYLDTEKTKKQKVKEYSKTKKQLEKERITRIKENDKLNQNALEMKLEKELQEKKKSIRETQERELFN